MNQMGTGLKKPDEGLNAFVRLFYLDITLTGIVYQMVDRQRVGNDTIAEETALPEKTDAWRFFSCPALGTGGSGAGRGTS